MALLANAPALADYSETATTQAAANAKPGIRHLPARDVAVPADEISPQEQAIIAAPYSPIFNAHPKNAAEWKAWWRGLRTSQPSKSPYWQKNSMSR